MMQIDELKDAEGKRLVKVFENWGEFLLVFDGGDTIVLTADGGGCDDEAVVVEEFFFLSTWMRFADELVELGVVTQEQVEKERNRKTESKRMELEAKKAEVSRLEKELSGQLNL